MPYDNSLGRTSEKNIAESPDLRLSTNSYGKKDKVMPMHKNLTANPSKNIYSAASLKKINQVVTQLDQKPNDKLFVATSMQKFVKRGSVMKLAKA